MANSARLALLLALPACAGPGPRPGQTDPAASRHEVRVHLAAGTVVQLLPVAFSGEIPSASRFHTIDGLWGVAMAQSVRFDIAAGVESCASETRIELHFDAASHSYTTTLQRHGTAPLALAAVAGSDTGTALDQLAQRTRNALGESVQRTPVPCTAAYSGERQCIRFTEMGLQRIVHGEFAAAIRLFEQARSHDGGSPWTLLHLAVTLANQPGQDHALRAARTAKEALGYAQRLTPGIEHRLARVLLLIRQADAQLLELGRAYCSDRPNDPHGTYSEALALNKMGDHAAALPGLRSLRGRWPRFPGVRYQLSFALLATGDGEEALTVLDEAKKGLAEHVIVRPYAMALFHSGRQDELRRYLRDLRGSRRVANSAAEHEIIRMQASHALLTGDKAAAVRALGESLAWVRKRRSILARYALDVAEDGEVLARLGATDVLVQAIRGFQELGQLPPGFASALTYLGGLVSVHANTVPDRALATLQKSHDTVWHNQLRAAVHHRRGELEAEARALQEAATGSSHPLIYASVARVLEAAGRRDASRRLATTVRQQLLSFDQRRPHEHPLMTPGRAMAFLATAPK